MKFTSIAAFVAVFATSVSASGSIWKNEITKMPYWVDNWDQSSLTNYLRNKLKTKLSDGTLSYVVGKKGYFNSTDHNPSKFIEAVTEASKRDRMLKDINDGNLSSENFDGLDETKKAKIQKAVDAHVNKKLSFSELCDILDAIDDVSEGQAQIEALTLSSPTSSLSSSPPPPPIISSPDKDENHSNTESSVNKHLSDNKYTYIFGGLGVVVLALLACILTRK